jgi:hypothetical protein
MRLRWLVVGPFLAWLLAVWSITLETWLFDAGAGASGASPLELFLNLTIPFTAGALAGWPPTASTRFAGLVRSGLAGLAIIEGNLVGELLLWTTLYHWIVGRPLAESAEPMGGSTEFLDLALTAGVVGLLLGALGCLTFWLISTCLRFMERPEEQ